MNYNIITSILYCNIYEEVAERNDHGMIKRFSDAPNNDTIPWSRHESMKTRTKDKTQG
jgi:hypothetical protein